MIDWVVWGSLMAALTTLFGYVLRHSTDSDKHPNKKDIVYKDVCNAEQERIADNLKAQSDSLRSHIDGAEGRYQELKRDLDKKLDRLEAMLGKLINGITRRQ